mmetsp:Transcript_68249/g.189520  ORF Transcript_68249/g.189520 Transcript_68249/m.189520 type:complete len:421 (-) Transcript_68249:125-1387(-)
MLRPPRPRLSHAGLNAVRVLERNGSGSSDAASERLRAEIARRDRRHARAAFELPAHTTTRSGRVTVPYYSFSLLMGQPADIPPLTSELTSALFQSLRPYNSADVGATVCPPTLVGTPASRGVASTMMIPRMVAFPTLAQCQSRAIAAALPMIGFGFMDNLVMIQAGNVPTDGSWRQAPTLNAINAHTRSLAGDLIDNTIGVTLGFAALTSAAFGQIFSDVSGICFGGMVEAAAARMGLASSGITAAQEKLRGVRVLSTVSAACGVVVGCLLGMTSLLFMDLGAADRKKMQEELRPLFETMMCDGANSVGAESCTLWIVDSDGEHLWSKVRQGPGTNLSNDESEVRIDLGAFPLRHEVVRLAAEGRPAILNCEDVQADPRFNSSADLYSGRTTRSLLVAPVVGDGGIVLAIVGEVGTNTNH